MRKRPTRTELFDGFYARLTAQGRDEVLFGYEREGARDFFRRCLITDRFPFMYFEFPLKGDPCLDMLATYKHIDHGARFAPGCGYGYQPVFDWFSRQEHLERPAIGLELDLSQGQTEHAGIYFQQMSETQLVSPFLDAVGYGQRAASYLKMAERLPKGWKTDYVGLFPARPDAPLRLGGTLSGLSQRRCAQDPVFLGSRFDLVGFQAYDAQMLDWCARLMGLAKGVEFQFDLLPDGALGDAFGLLVSFSHVGPKKAASSFASGYAAAVMETFEKWGLADSRWRLIPDVTTARRVDYERDGGGTGHLAASLCLDYAKVKFVGGVAMAAKFYLSAAVREMD